MGCLHTGRGGPSLYDPRLNVADQLTHNRFANQKFDAAKVLALSLMNHRGAGVTDGKSKALRVPGGGTAVVPSGTNVTLRVLEGEPD